MIKRWLLGAVLLVLAVLLAPASASAQYSCQVYTQNENRSDEGTFKLYAATIKNNCGGTFVEAWLDAGLSGCWNGIGQYASEGNITDLPICYQHDYDGNYDQTRAFPYLSGSCGTTGGHTLNEWRYPGTGGGSYVIDNFTLTIGSCGGGGQECNEYNGYWDPDLGRWICYSPIVVATGKDQNYSLTSALDGVLFDLNADGVLERVAWTKASSNVALLAIDFNGNGVIDNGSELLGNHTVPGQPNGFDALIALQAAQAGTSLPDVSEGSPLYPQLLLWHDTNHDGRSQATELSRFSDRYAALGLAYKPHNRRDGNGNAFRFEGYVLERTKPGKNGTTSQADADARRRKIYDVYFTVAR